MKKNSDLKLGTEFDCIHFIGIGGSGISALARLAHQCGYKVSGSNMSSNALTKELKEEGIKVFENHKPDHLSPETDLVIKTSAATLQSPAGAEIQAALDKKIPVEHREFLINKFAKKHKRSIGISGTHGKTTTTSIIAHCLVDMALHPSYLIGGELKTTGTNAAMGKDEFFVWEADEFNNHYHGVKQECAIINNIEYDHPDVFDSEEDYIQSFIKFINENVTRLVILNLDDENIRKLIEEEKITTNFATFGHQQSDADYKWRLIEDTFTDMIEFVIDFDGKDQAIYSSLSGRHNIFNMTAAFALLHKLGFHPEQITSALTTFPGSGRRFETIYKSKDKNTRVISDYAHHPTAIRMTVTGAKEKFGENNKIVAVLEPHQYQRVAELLPSYKHIFDDADQVIVLPIYASRDPDKTITSQLELADTIEHPKLSTMDYDELLKTIKSDIRSGSDKVYLCMSAGKLDGVLRSKLAE